MIINVIYIYYSKLFGFCWKKRRFYRRDVQYKFRIDVLKCITSRLNKHQSPPISIYHKSDIINLAVFTRSTFPS